MLPLFRQRLSMFALPGVLALLLAACGTAPAAQPTMAPAAPSEVSNAAPTGAPAAVATPLNVIATYSILGDLVANVAGDRVNLTTLVGPGSDPHVYQPTPRDSAALAGANLLFENGLEFESWLDDLFVAAGSQATRVVVTEQITLLAFDGHAEGEEAHAEGEEAHADEHGEYDPHVWQDVNNARLMVETIRDALVAADSANAEIYQANAAAYLAELEELDTFAQAQVATLPEERRKLVTNHDTFGYFADRYGFEVVGTALGASTELSDPSAGAVAELIEQIRATGAPAIFTENTANPALMETLAREAGVTLAPTLFTDALGAPGSPGATYLEMIRFNVTTIVSALSE